jgi:thiamine biosynthesis lipoprotein
MPRPSLFALLLSVLLPVAAGPALADWHADTAEKMGTRIEIRVWNEDPERARALIRAGMAEFDRIESWMSTYREDSEISRVNREAALAPVPVSRELHDIVARSLELSARSGGAFDITFDSVGRLYDFRARVRPGEAEIRENLPAINWRNVVLDPATPAIRFTAPGTRINLGGIGKGYACEKVAALLAGQGVRHGLVNAGGDTRFIGDNLGRPWVVGIQDPDNDQRWVTRLVASNEAVSTAGDYERYFDENGVRYHHIINPRTGDSARGVRSVTVVGPDATLTDGLDNAVFVLGPEDGLALIDATPGYEAVVVDDQRRVFLSRGLRGESEPAPAAP